MNTNPERYNLGDNMQHTLPYLTLLPSLLILACGPVSNDSPNDTEEETSRLQGKGDIIGQDDRLTEDSQDIPSHIREFARSTSMLTKNTQLEQTEQGDWILKGTPYWTRHQMCPDEPFVQESKSGFCTGWLIASNIMMTNGHCIKTKTACEQTSFIFDHTGQNAHGEDFIIPNENVVGCKQILAQDETSFCEVDFAVVELDRHITNRTPFQVQPSASPPTEPLGIIGHPLGLPRKYSLEGDIFSVTGNLYSVTHDTFGGNSGSPAFDLNTGLVHGILTCGQPLQRTREEWNSAWLQEERTNLSCEQGCSAEHPVGFIDPPDICATSDQRRRCSCVNNISTWEAQECLPFEENTKGHCFRFGRGDEEEIKACTQTLLKFQISTDVCLGGQLIQRANSFARYAKPDWKTLESTSPQELSNQNPVITEPLTLPEGELIQAFSVFLDIEQHRKDTLAIKSLDDNLDITLVHTYQNNSTRLDLKHTSAISGEPLKSSTYYEAVNMPFLVRDMEGIPAGGNVHLEITNKGTTHTLNGWKINMLTSTEQHFEHASYCKDQMSCCTPTSCPNHPMFADQAPQTPSAEVEDFTSEAIAVEHPYIRPSTTLPPSLEAQWQFKSSIAKNGLHRFTPPQAGQLISAAPFGHIEIFREFNLSQSSQAYLDFSLRDGTTLEVWQGDQLIKSFNTLLQLDQWETYNETIEITPNTGNILRFVITNTSSSEQAAILKKIQIEHQ